MAGNNYTTRNNTRHPRDSELRSAAAFAASKEEAALQQQQQLAAAANYNSQLQAASSANDMKGGNNTSGGSSNNNHDGASSLTTHNSFKKGASLSSSSKDKSGPPPPGYLHHLYRHPPQQFTKDGKVASGVTTWGKLVTYYVLIYKKSCLWCTQWRLGYHNTTHARRGYTCLFMPIVLCILDIYRYYCHTLYVLIFLRSTCLNSYIKNVLCCVVGA